MQFGFYTCMSVSVSVSFCLFTVIRVAFAVLINEMEHKNKWQNKIKTTKQLKIERGKKTSSIRERDRDNDLVCTAKKIYIDIETLSRCRRKKMFENVAPNWLVNTFFHFCTRMQDSWDWSTVMTIFFTLFHLSSRHSQCTVLFAVIPSRLNQYLYFLFEFCVDKKRMYK